MSFDPRNLLGRRGDATSTQSWGGYLRPTTPSRGSTGVLDAGYASAE